MLKILGTVVIAFSFMTSLAFCAATTPTPYAPYEVLIGDWDVGKEGATPSFAFHFKWGPGKSYIWCAASMIEDGKEYPHFEGMLLWNEVHKNLDMLFAVGLDGPGMQEQGTVFVDESGTIIREISAVSSQGAQQFRQTFKVEGNNRMITTVLRETKDGWVATFPGSDRLIMTRRAAAKI